MASKYASRKSNMRSYRRMTVHRRPFNNHDSTGAPFVARHTHSLTPFCTPRSPPPHFAIAFRTAFTCRKLCTPVSKVMMIPKAGVACLFCGRARCLLVCTYRISEHGLGGVSRVTQPREAAPLVVFDPNGAGR